MVVNKDTGRQKMKVRFFDIVWDTDDQEVDLPSTVEAEVDANFDIDEDGADILSEQFSWCVKSFDYVVL